MGKYFTNETLDGLWTRLVNKTKELYETEGDGSYIYTSDDHEEYICGTCGSTNGLGSIPCPGCGNIPDFGRSLINTGMRGIHDALLSYTGLERNTSPTKLADYMKGIATCARYVAKGYTDYTSKNTLKQIVKMLEEGSDEGDCNHTDTHFEYEDMGNGTHTVRKICSNSACGQEVAVYINDCTYKNGFCIHCDHPEPESPPEQCSVCGGTHSYPSEYCAFCGVDTHDVYYDSRYGCGNPAHGNTPGTEDNYYCGNCGAELYDAGATCESCGWSTSAYKDMCGECGAEVWGHWNDDAKVFTCLDGHNNYHGS